MSAVLATLFMVPGVMATAFDDDPLGHDGLAIDAVGEWLPIESSAASSPFDLLDEVPDLEAVATVPGFGVAVPLPGAVSTSIYNPDILITPGGANLYCERYTTSSSQCHTSVPAFDQDQYIIHWCVGACDGWGTTNAKIIMHLGFSFPGTTKWCVDVTNGVYTAQCSASWGAYSHLEGDMGYIGGTRVGWYSVDAR